MKAPDSLADWTDQMRQRLAKRNAILGIVSSVPAEVFTVTAWGALPSVAQLKSDFPQLLSEACHFGRLEEKLNRWSGL